MDGDGTNSLEPLPVEGPLLFRHGDIELNLPEVTGRMRCEEGLDLKVFVKEFVLCNITKLRSLSVVAIVSAAGELETQRFASQGVWQAGLLRSVFQKQFEIVENLGILKVCQDWLDLIGSDTALDDLLFLWMDASGQGKVDVVNDAQLGGRVMSPKAQNVVRAAQIPSPFAPTTGIAGLQRDRLPSLVSENKSIHVLLPSQGEPRRAPSSHIHIIRPSDCTPEHRAIELVLAFDLSLIATFASQALRDEALSELKAIRLNINGSQFGPLDVVCLADDERSRGTTMTLPAGSINTLRRALTDFFTYSGRIRASDLVPGPVRNGSASSYFKMPANVLDLSARRWLLKVMRPDAEHQAVIVEVQPERNCQLFITDPRVRSRAAALGSTSSPSKPSIAATSSISLQLSTSIADKDAKSNLSEPGHAATGGSLAQCLTSTPPRTGKTIHMPDTEPQPQVGHDVAQAITGTSSGKALNNDSVPHEE